MCTVKLHFGHHFLLIAHSKQIFIVKISLSAYLYNGQVLDVKCLNTKKRNASY